MGGTALLPSRATRPPPASLPAGALGARGGGTGGAGGAALDCPLCDRAELPADLRVVRTTALWDERTMPAGLRRSHRVAAGVWGRLRVREGELRFRARTHPPLDAVVGPGAEQAIPPEVEHEVEPLGEVAFLIEFLRR